MVQTIVYNKGEIASVVQKHIVPRICHGSILIFRGLLGAGKTTLIKTLLATLGCIQEVTSPTFSYVHAYKLSNRICYHFDLYRVDNKEAFFQLGFEEYIMDKSGLIVIEWPEVICTLLSASQYRDRIITLELKYQIEDPELRTLVIR